MNRSIRTSALLFLSFVFFALNCAEKKKIQSRYSFVKTVVAESLNEPMQLAELPNGKIMFIERHGAIKLYDPASGSLSTAHQLAVVDSLEDGLIGMAVDPKWTENHWIYLYYSPVGQGDVNQLSRFVFDENGVLDPASEKAFFQVKVQRQECCHSGGCLRYGDDGYLYLSTGDNTNATDDYAVIDERPGRGPWDAQKSAANSMDLRGKILRIKPLPDGSYICPAGNLFTEEDVHVSPPRPPHGGEGSSAPDISQVDNDEGNMAKSSAQDTGKPASDTASEEKSKVSPPLSGGLWGAPEIYIMGCRNPFRMSIDPRRKLLFWGDVGPDASNPDTARGPEGFDEINRAAAAGNYGWPYFIANNKAYRDYDFETKKSGPFFDTLHPFNDSPNNAGARDLPPALPAIIWYPYGPSAEFPILDEYEGDGGRNAMAGPVYYADLYPEETRLPDHYDGKLFIYDWMRNWIMAVTLDSAGNYISMEHFADDVNITCPMDMLIDRNGVMWILEYGTQRYSANPDARLSRIDLVRENRPPVPALQADKNAGAAPLTVVFSVSQTRDPEGDPLSYEIDFGDGTAPWMFPADRKEANSTNANDLDNNELDNIQHVFENTGTYEVTLKVTDAAGKSDTVKQRINVGNEPPLVFWDLEGNNRSFYRPGDVLNYKIIVDDLEDGTLANGGIAPASVATTIDYSEAGFDIAVLTRKHKSAGAESDFAKGKTLIERADCKTCHAPDKLVNGPAYQAIAERYRGDKSVLQKLAQKIIHGGGGNWGQTVMTPHTQLTEADASEMVRWILSLGAAPKPKQTLPVAGKYTLRANAKNPGTFILKAAYLDKGAKGQPPLEAAEILALRPALQQAEQADSMSKGVAVYHPFDNDVAVLNNLIHNLFFCFKHVDLTGLNSILIRTGMSDQLNQYAGGRIELRLDSPEGLLAGQVDIPLKNGSEKMEFTELTLPVSGPADGQFHDLYFVFKNDSAPGRPVAAVDWVRFNLEPPIR